jgi:hypothetical protein
LSKRTIFGREIELNTFIPLEFSEEDSLITQLDYTDAVMHAPLPSELSKTLRGIQIRSEPEAKLDHWMVGGKGTYVGAWSKRYSKYVKKLTGVNLDPSHLSIISETLQRSIRSGIEPLIIEFTDHADWNPGKFGDNGSCWFGGAQDSSRAGLIKFGGGGICIYTKDEEPRARLWYAPVERGTNAVLFNIYDKQNTLSMLGISRLLAMKFGVSYKRLTSIYMPNTYLNGGDSAFVVGHPLLDRPVTLTFAMPPTSVVLSVFMPFAHADSGSVYKIEATGNLHTCADCDYVSESIEDNKSFRQVDDYWVCEACRDEHYSYCVDCDEWYHEDNISYYEELDSSVCENCIGNYPYCEGCDRHFSRDDNGITTEEDGWRCEGCSEDYRECDHQGCGKVYKKDDMYTAVDEEMICTACGDRYYSCCEHCGDYVLTDDSTQVFNDDGESAPYCPDCTRVYAWECVACERYFKDGTNCDCEEEEEEDIHADPNN